MGRGLMPEEGTGDNQRVASQPSPVDEERRMRRAMRVGSELWAKNSRPTVPATLLRSALLVAGGFCLGWGALRFWPRFHGRVFCC